MNKLTKLLYKRKQLVFFIHSHINGFGHAVAFALELEEDDEKPKINVCFCDPWRYIAVELSDLQKSSAPLGGTPISEFIEKQFTPDVLDNMAKHIKEEKKREKEKKEDDQKRREEVKKEEQEKKIDDADRMGEEQLLEWLFDKQKLEILFKIYNNTYFQAVDNDAEIVLEDQK